MQNQNLPDFDQPTPTMRKLRNGRTKIDDLIFTAGNPIVAQSMNTKIPIDVKLNSASISIFVFIK